LRGAGFLDSRLKGPRRWPCGRRRTAPSDLSTGGRRVSERSERCGVGASSAADPGGVAARATAQDRHAGGDERYSLFAAQRLSLALSTPRRPFHHFRLPTNIFRKFQCDGVWRMRSGPSCNGVASDWAERPAPRLRFSTTNRSTRQKNGRQRQPGRLRRRQAGEGPQDTPWSIAKGCRCGSSSTPPRSRTATGLDKIRRRFPWLGLIWADGGYNAWQVDAAVVKVPPLRTEIVKRSDDTRSFVVLPRR